MVSNENHLFLYLLYQHKTGKSSSLVLPYPIIEFYFSTHKISSYSCISEKSNGFQ